MPAPKWPTISPRDKFGEWTIIKLSRKDDHSFILWFAKCNCGTVREVREEALLRGASRSCGCIAARKAKALFTKHSMSRTPTHQAWRAMRYRCTRPSHPSYHNYGGRGISVCQEWMESFMQFLSDMGEKPKGLTLERIDNNKGYYKENCKWATHREQCRNMRKSRIFEYKGERKTLAEWSEITGIHQGTLRNRIEKNWPIGKIFKEPAPPHNRREKRRNNNGNT